jgi:type VI secretion system secreted protein Hcp
MNSPKVCERRSAFGKRSRPIDVARRNGARPVSVLRAIPRGCRIALARVRRSRSRMRQLDHERFARERSSRGYNAPVLLRGARLTGLRSDDMAADIFAKLGDIKGESIDDKHKDEIEVLSYSWGVTNSGTMLAGGGAAAGRATFKDISIVHHVDKASPKLMQACATGTHLAEATITQRKAGKGQQEFLVIKMNDVIITSVSPQSSGPDGLTETVALAFAKIDVEYTPQKADGSLDAALQFKYDLKANREF